jgi:hypothetical protein
MSIRKLTKNQTHNMGVRLFMQKVMSLFIYHELQNQLNNLEAQPPSTHNDYHCVKPFFT